MSVCVELHRLVRHGTLHSFPFDVARLPRDGIYVLFERGETGHDGSRIVRVGTHRGDGELPSRLLQHFVRENKDRSIFRKHMGRAFLNTDPCDPYLAEWQHDRTSRAGRARFGEEPDPAKVQAIERDVTQYSQAACSFVAFTDAAESDRMTFESKLISTVSLCDECRASDAWLGLRCTNKRVRESGLWNDKELYKQPLSSDDVAHLSTLLM
jgi:hypothetical protein